MYDVYIYKIVLKHIYFVKHFAFFTEASSGSGEASVKKAKYFTK